MQIIRALLVHTFMYDEELTVFLRNESISAMRASKFHGCVPAFFRKETSVADLTKELPFGTIVLIEIDNM